jgi:hypothetical protein
VGDPPSLARVGEQARADADEHTSRPAKAPVAEVVGSTIDELMVAIST